MADESLSHADMEVVYGSANIPNSRASSGNNESGSRQGAEDSERPVQLNDPSTTVCTDREEDGVSTSGHVCICLTHQLPRYFSWRPDPATDAFSQDWSQFQGYANPPWCLLLPTLAKIQRERARVVLVA